MKFQFFRQKYVYCYTINWKIHLEKILFYKILSLEMLNIELIRGKYQKTVHKALLPIYNNCDWLKVVFIFSLVWWFTLDSYWWCFKVIFYLFYLSKIYKGIQLAEVFINGINIIQFFDYFVAIIFFN